MSFMSPCELTQKLSRADWAGGDGKFPVSHVLDLPPAPEELRGNYKKQFHRRQDACRQPHHLLGPKEEYCS